jgi:hypothetical protein
MGTGGSGGAGGGELAQPTLMVTLTPDTVVAGDTATLNMTVTNFKVVQPGSAKPGEGHFHIYIDNDPNYGAAVATTAPLTTMAGDKGVHMIRVALVNGLHQPITPAVEATVMLTVN